MSSHPHPTSAEFEVFLHDASRPGAAVSNTRIVQHLLTGCPACRERLDDMGWETSRLERLLQPPSGSLEDEDTISAASSGYDYSQAFASAERALAAFFTKGRPAEASAEELWAELSSLSTEEQVRRVGTDRRFASPELVEHLVEAGQAVR